MSESIPVGGDEKSLYERDKVVRIINSVIEKVEEVEEYSREALYGELRELKAVIDEARAEISAIRPLDINSKHIPTATDELDAIIQATEEATGSIMDACDGVEEHVSKLESESSSAIMGYVTKIYEACSFQDITGQRISKVVGSLKHIEEKVEKMLDVMSEKVSGDTTEEPEKVTGDAALMNGPQMADKAISQDEIDKLLAEFD